ncbi:MAG: PQQ-binding-like beta-propeller repeat protein [Vicinamibacteria bacterium]
MLTVLLALTAAVSIGTGDWTQWRGPGRDGAAALADGAPWPAELSRRWRVAVGSGQSSPVVAGDVLFVFSREGDDEVARALDLATGRERWRRAYAAPYRVYPGAASYGSGPRSTPVIHEGRLFTLGIGGILTAFDAKDGRIAWQKDFTGRFPATAPPFGTSMSPLVASGNLIVHAGGHDGGALIAFDPATGAERWVLDGDGPSYSSPIVTTFDGQEQVVIQVHRRILGVDPVSGRALWSVPFVTPCDQNIVTPLRAADLLVVSNRDTGTQAIRVVRSGAGWKAIVAWHSQDVSMYMSSPVLAHGLLIGLSHRKRGQYFALDPATGAVRWTSDPGQGENAAFVTAGADLLVLQGDGTLLVAPSSASSFTPRHRYRVAESATFAHPVPSKAGLLIKDDDGVALHALRPAPRASR